MTKGHSNWSVCPRTHGIHRPSRYLTNLTPRLHLFVLRTEHGK